MSSSLPHSTVQVWEPPSLARGTSGVSLISEGEPFTFLALPTCIPVPSQPQCRKGRRHSPSSDSGGPSSFPARALGVRNFWPHTHA